MVPRAVGSPRGERSVIESPQSESQSAHQPGAGDDARIVPGKVNRAGDHVVGNQRLGGKIIRRQSANDHAGMGTTRRCENLALDHRSGKGDIRVRRHVTRKSAIALKAAGGRGDGDMTLESEDLADEFMTKSVHHGHDDDEGADPEADPDKREPGCDGDEPLLTPGFQVAQRYRQFECSDHERDSRMRGTASSSASSTRWPSDRRLSSTLDDAAPRGPMMICQGRPMRSMSENFTPALSSRSS